MQAFCNDFKNWLFKTICSQPFYSIGLGGLHDDSANDDLAIDKMAARFWHTDDSATFLFEK